MRRLTELQAAFCRYLITGMSATQAAREAGYSPSYADREAAKLVVKPQVAAELQRLRAKIEAKAIVTAEEVLEGLKGEALDKSLGSSHAARVAAWAHLGRHLNLFTDRHEVTIKKHPSEMTDEELDKALQDAGLL